MLLVPTKTLTDTFVKHTITTTAAIASDITQIGVSFAFTHAGAGVTTNYFEVSQVQLCAGSVALPFQPKSYAQELADCQRYCLAYNLSASSPLATGNGIGTTFLYATLNLPVEMRTIPTMTATASDWAVSDWTAGNDCTALSIFRGSPSVLLLKATVASGITQFKFYNLSTDASARSLYFDAEL